MRKDRLLIAGLGLLILAGLIGRAISQAPGELPGCQYNATPPTLSDKQTVVIQCDVNGKIITH